MSKPVSMLCLYRVKKGAEEEFRALLEAHWPTMHRLGLVTETPAQTYTGATKSGTSTAFIEMFEWKDEEAPQTAHKSAEMKKVWEPMIPLTESMEFLAIEPLHPPKADG